MALLATFEQAVDALERDAAFGGVEVVSHAAHRHARVHRLQVVVDRDGGVDLSLCERIASSLNRALDACDEPYTLEVESAGLERPLTKAGDYARFSGRRVKVVTSLLISGAKTHRGVLTGVRGTNVILQTDRGELPLPLAAVKSAHLEYDIRSDLNKEKKERKHHGNR
ncbi:MAG: hypothetical protein JOZ38_00820 [Candidatus Eremiobacteraeota bacterium]|nr:hypothetical protein [Candidatus Eremiobacteraeota bacterium]